MRSTPRRSRTLPAVSLAVAGLAAGVAVPVGLSAVGRPGGEAAPATPTPGPSGAECRTSVRGSRVVAHCHNPYPSTDRVQLHTECRRWWDVDADTAPVDVGPGRTVRLDGRCWKEAASAWVTHHAPAAPDDPPR
ncbi:hypothetical protein AB0E67_05890 [Streptomyces sp. NPDC032161]|uniref:hypothetical protein n=1 Tax=unclassified Streptomyces TaxID=2593676 RepID=UPI0033E37850